MKYIIPILWLSIPLSTVPCNNKEMANRGTIKEEIAQETLIKQINFFMHQPVEKVFFKPYFMMLALDRAELAQDLENLYQDPTTTLDFCQKWKIDQKKLTYER